MDEAPLVPDNRVGCHARLVERMPTLLVHKNGWRFGPGGNGDHCSLLKVFAMPLRRLVRSVRSRLRPQLRPFSLMARYRLTGAKIDRNQWHAPSPESKQAYRAMLERTWDELGEHNPDYFARLSHSVEHATGRVLEIGCGMGNMTRWLAPRPEVESILAVDAFPQAIEQLQALGLEGVECRTMAADELKFTADDRFDTVMLCEVVEHLYPDEEMALLESIRPHLAERARFVVSVPIGWLEDPHHVRAFSLRGFQRHLRRHYGNPEGVDVSSGYSQVAWGTFKGSESGAT